MDVEISTEESGNDVDATVLALALHAKKGQSTRA